MHLDWLLEVVHFRELFKRVSDLLCWGVSQFILTSSWRSESINHNKYIMICKHQVFIFPFWPWKWFWWTVWLHKTNAYIWTVLEYFHNISQETAAIEFPGCRSWITGKCSFTWIKTFVDVCSPAILLIFKVPFFKGIKQWWLLVPGTFCTWKIFNLYWFLCINITGRKVEYFPARSVRGSQLKEV